MLGITPAITTSIVIPAYNEEEGLPLVLNSLIQILNDAYEIIVVDDGSKDNSAKIAASYPCRVIKHQDNQGKGAAIRTGLVESRGKNVIFLDADNTYPVDSIPWMVELLEEYDLVRGNRSDGRANIPLINRIGNSMFDTILRVTHAVDGGDVLSGIYGGHRDDMLELNLRSNGFDIEAEIVTKARAHGLTSKTFPIAYNERAGEKKLKAFQDGTKILMKIMLLALAYNPLLALGMPGLGLFTLGIGGLIFMFLGLHHAIGLPLSYNSAFVLGMFAAFGMQIMVFGLAVYEAGVIFGLLGRTSPLVETVRKIFSAKFFFFCGLGMSIAGVTLTTWISTNWFAGGFGPFDSTVPLVCSALLMIIGFQLVSSTAFLTALKQFKNIYQINSKAVSLS